MTTQNVDGQGGHYPSAEISAMGYDLDADAPQQVMAYVSRGIIYQVDEHCNVIAFGRLTRREVLA